MKKKSCTRAWCGVLAAALVVTSTSSVMLAEAAKAPKLNKKTITLRAGAKKQLKVKNLKKKQKVKWKSSKKKIATVSKKGLVRAKKIGITKIVAKVGKKKLVCHVRVLPKKIVIRRPKPMPVATPVRVVTPKPTAIVQPSETTNVSPTMDVTAKPTIAPTVKPTMVPTVKPTTAPTATPTASPSSAPTTKPTASPSTAPTALPTKMPSAAPLPTPARTTTPSPSAAPIVKPTASPSTAPTATAKPTQTAKPSATPTATPTATPSAAPQPSATPTATPTPTQTAKPSASPIVTPAPTPSAAPQPSATPTATPTVKPTATPTVKPTATPTVKPTATPTVKPTATPTVKPTATPTVKPTATPTVKPTATPTVKPTATPTVKPTATPTAKPTATPTAKPTATPTVKPTATPTVKPTATPTVKPTATPTAKPTATPTAKPTATPSGNAGQNVNLNGKKAFTIAGYQLALGLTRDEVNTVLGSLKTDVKRTAKSPQGFDVIAFRAGGNGKNINDKYSTYILIYLKDDIVVGISGNASSMNFDGAVSYGTSAATLVSNGWVDVDWYKTTAGDAAAYSKDVDNATIIAFADAYGDDKVYSIQIFNNAYSIADMTQCTETTLPMNYSADVLTEMETETFEILNAYLVNTGVRAVDDKALRKNTKASNVARAYSKEIADEGCIDAANAERELALSKAALKNAGLSFAKWGERILIGNMDAIGFANSVIESERSRDTLISTDYVFCGIGASVYTESAGKAVYYPNMVIDFVDRVSAL